MTQLMILKRKKKFKFFFQFMRGKNYASRTGQISDMGFDLEAFISKTLLC